MSDKEEQFLLKNFSRYYEKAHLGVERIGEREFGMGGRAKKIEVRHMAFGSNEELRNGLINETPFYVSYSTAFYERPAGRPMEKKGWKSAQVVFDIDAHHEGELFVCEKCMQWAKDSTFRLVEDFLVSDFGLKKDELDLNFSGNRGFHVHVKNAAFEHLTRYERKELTDYVTGTGLDQALLFREEKKVLEEKDLQNLRERSVKIMRGPTLDSGGYGGKIVLALKKNGYFGAIRKQADIALAEKGIARGNWAVFQAKVKKRFPLLVSKCIGQIRVDIDVNTTCDVSRLIRLPNSIHGASGLVAKKIAFPDLEKFNPLDDAMVFGSGELKVVPTMDLKDVYMKGRTFSFEKGKLASVPGYLVVYLLCKEAATLA